MTLTYSRVSLGALVWTVDEVKAHLRISDTAHDDDILQKLETAQEAILAYLGPAGDASWTAETMPKGIKHGILLIVGLYYDANRGDDPTHDAKAWSAVRELIGSYRDIGIA